MPNPTATIRIILPENLAVYDMKRDVEISSGNPELNIDPKWGSALGGDNANPFHIDRAGLAQVPDGEILVKVVLLDKKLKFKVINDKSIQFRGLD